MAIPTATEPNRPATNAHRADRTGTADTRTTEPNHPRTGVPNHPGEPANHPGRTTLDADANHPSKPALVTLPPGWLAALGIMLGTGIAIAVSAFLFSFKNIEHLAETLDIIESVRPWIAPTVDLGIVGMAVAVQWLALAGVSDDKLKGAHRWLVFSGFLTLALNAAPAAIIGYTDGDAKAYGRALVESVAPTMLIGWTYYLPRLVQLFVDTRTQQREAIAAIERRRAAAEADAEQAAVEAAFAIEQAEQAARLAAAQDARERELADAKAAADLRIAEAQQLADIERAKIAAQAAAEQARIAAAERRQEADRTDARAQAERDRELAAAQLAAQRAAAEADAAREQAAAAQAAAAAETARLAAAQLERATAAARTATRTGSDQQATRSGTATGTRTGKRTEPANPPANVVSIGRGEDGMRAHLREIHAALKPADDVHSWAEVNDRTKIGLNELHRRTGIRKPSIMKALEHAHDILPWPGDPVAGDDSGEATG